MVTMLPSTRSVLTANSSSTTKMDAILTALRGFQATHGRLPCPADASQPIGASSYGVEAANIGTEHECLNGATSANYADFTNNIALGMLPVQTLSLSNDYALDSFGRDYTYAVDTNATTCGWTTATQPGTITVVDNGSEFTAQSLRDWLKDLGVRTAYIEPGSPWENAYASHCTSFGHSDRSGVVGRRLDSFVPCAFLGMSELGGSYRHSGLSV